VQIRAVVEPHSQADPKFQTPLAFTRITSKAVREALLAKSDLRAEDVPAERTLVTILNRMGYCLRRVLKTRPQKRFARQTRSSIMCEPLTNGPRRIPRACVCRSTRRPK
jgi:hypothetical protein